MLMLNVDMLCSVIVVKALLFTASPLSVAGENFCSFSSAGDSPISLASIAATYPLDGINRIDIQKAALQPDISFDLDIRTNEGTDEDTSILVRDMSQGVSIGTVEVIDDAIVINFNYDAVVGNTNEGEDGNSAMRSTSSLAAWALLVFSTFFLSGSRVSVYVALLSMCLLFLRPSIAEEPCSPLVRIHINMAQGLEARVEGDSVICDEGCGASPPIVSLLSHMAAADGAIEPPSGRRLLAEGEVIAIGPPETQHSRPVSMGLAIESVYICRRTRCNGTYVGPYLHEDDTMDGTCAVGYVELPSVDGPDCIVLYQNVAMGESEDRETHNRYTGDGEFGGDCAVYRRWQEEGYYTDMVDNQEVESKFSKRSEILKAQIGSYKYAAVQVRGDMLVKAEVPMSNGHTLYSKPCGCSICPNPAAFGGLSNPNVKCLGGTCATCDATPPQPFYNVAGHQQYMRCVNNMTVGPAHEVSVRQYSEMQFEFLEPLKIESEGVPIEHWRTESRLENRTICQNVTVNANLTQELCEDREMLMNHSVLDRVVVNSVNVDLAFVLDGVIRGVIGPNRAEYVPDFEAGTRDLHEILFGDAGQISDGYHSIDVGTMALTAIVRSDNERLLKYTQVVDVGPQCRPVQGSHPCTDPIAIYTEIDHSGDQTGRHSACQRHQQFRHSNSNPPDFGWRDANVNTTGMKPTISFKLMIHSFYTAPDDELPANLRAVRGFSIAPIFQVEQTEFVPCSHNSDERYNCTRGMPFDMNNIMSVRPSLVDNAEEDALDLISRTGPEYIYTASVKGFRPLGSIGSSYDRVSSHGVQVLLNGQDIVHMKPEDAGPDVSGSGSGHSRFINHRYTDVYFDCPAHLESILDITNGEYV